VWTGLRFPTGAGKNFFFRYRVQMGTGAHGDPIQWIQGTLSPGVKRPASEADHSPPPSVEVNSPIRLHGSVLSYAKSYDFMAWCLVKDRDAFTFAFLQMSESKPIW
jgi:hypothetical protein